MMRRFPVQGGQTAAEFLEKAILGVSLCVMGVLAVPVCVCALPVLLVWTATDRLLRALARVQMRSADME